MGRMCRCLFVVLICIVAAEQHFAVAGLKPFPIGRPNAVPEADWQLAQGMPGSKTDLRLVGGGKYSGGIDRTWYLIVSGPPRKRFYYHFVGIEKTQLALRGTWVEYASVTHGVPSVGFAIQVSRQCVSSPIQFVLVGM